MHDFLQAGNHVIAGCIRLTSPFADEKLLAMPMHYVEWWLDRQCSVSICVVLAMPGMKGCHGRDTGLSSRSLSVLYRPIKSQPNRIIQAYQVAA